MEDIKDTWADAQNRINQAVNKKAIEIGMIRDKYQFNEFDIQDTYEAYDGTLCMNCRRNLKCTKHQLKKKQRPLIVR